MKILFTVEFYEPHKGGAQEVVKQLAERLFVMGHIVTVATTFLAERKEAIINGVKIEGFKIHGNTVRGIIGAREELQRYETYLQKDWDVIINYAAQIWTTDLMFPIFQNISAKKIMIPCGYSGLHNPTYKTYFEQLPAYLKQYDRLVYMSENYQDKTFGDMHGLADKAVIVPNGAAAEEFIGVPGAKKMLGITTPHLAISVSNHYKEKGHHFTIEAFKKMNRTDTTLLIVGTIPGAGWKKFAHVVFGCYFSCLIQNIFHKNIKSIPGTKRELVLAAYDAADVFLFGSSVECAPLVMYESFASRTAFITRNVGNVKDHAQFLKIANTTLHMAETANELLDDSTKRNELTTGAYDLWQKNHTWEHSAKNYEELLRTLQ